MPVGIPYPISGVYVSWDTVSNYNVYVSWDTVSNYNVMRFQLGYRIQLQCDAIPVGISQFWRTTQLLLHVHNILYKNLDVF